MTKIKTTIYLVRGSLPRSFYPTKKEKRERYKNNRILLLRKLTINSGLLNVRFLDVNTRKQKSLEFPTRIIINIINISIGLYLLRKRLLLILKI